MADLRRCPEHGFFAADAPGSGTGPAGGCPDCGTAGEVVLDADRRRRLSRFVSGALRHFPGDVGFRLDDRGWAPYADVVAAVERRYDWADTGHLAAIVATDPKGRFERDGDRIRAAYGHSVDVDLEPTDGPVPATLYHGTAARNVAAIREEGLRPMDRQQVHLSGSIAAARDVGRRHADEPVVFEVDAERLQRAGNRVAKRGHEVYTTDRVSPEYLTMLDG